jgi:hypothetical protein
MINESWRRPPSETTEEKRVKELERDLSTYRAQEPKISISSCATTDESSVVEVTRKVAAPLTKVEVEVILEALRSKHPLITDFTPPQPSITADSFGAVITIEYTSPTDEDIANYRNVLYPQWLEQCSGILKNLHEGRDEVEPRVVLHWLMSNKGTRPASHVRIEFEAHGSLELRRLPAETEDGEVVDIDIASSRSRAARFPPPPRPSFQQHASAASSRDEKYRGIADLSKAALGPHYPFVQHPKGFEAGAAFAVASQIRSSMIGTPGLDAILKPSGPSISHQLIQAARDSIPKARNPETFYYDWPATRQVEKGALTCELWRHQTGEEEFSFEVLFAKEGEANGMVQCTVHAENLTKPEQARVIVVRTIKTLGIIDSANAMIEACK